MRRFDPNEWIDETQAAIFCDMGIGEMAIAATLISGAISAYGAYSQGQSQKAMYGYESQVAANNAAIQRQNAAWATAKGESAAADQGQRTRQMVGEQMAVQAAQGINVDQGSAVDVRASTAMLGEQSALNIRSNAAREAYGYDVGAVSETAQSQLDRMAGANAATAGEIGAVGSLVGAAGSAGSEYMSWQNVAPASTNLYDPTAGVTGVTGLPYYYGVSQ